MIERAYRAAVSLLALLSVPAAMAQPVPILPPLADPPTNIQLPGKFVWADLFTTRVDASVDFYTRMFDLEWQALSSDPDRYGIFLHDGLPVAGLARHEGPEVANDYGRWVHFLSVRDVEAALTSLVDRGGRVLLAARDYPRRGRIAIAAGPEGELIGLIRSSSGDPEDYRAERGEWIWRELLVPDPAAAAETYADFCDCTLTERTERPGNFLMISQDYLRAGITALDLNGGDATLWLGFVRVDDLPAALERARQLGATVSVQSQSEATGESVAVIIDPVGAALALVHWDFEVTP